MSAYLINVQISNTRRHVAGISVTCFLDREFQTFDEALAQAPSRTPEEIVAARTRLIQASPPPHEIPEGKTLEDVVMGKWAGDETGEQIFDALQKLS